MGPTGIAVPLDVQRNAVTQAMGPAAALAQEHAILGMHVRKPLQCAQTWIQDAFQATTGIVQVVAVQQAAWENLRPLLFPELVVAPANISSSMAISVLWLFWPKASVQTGQVCSAQLPHSTSFNVYFVSEPCTFDAYLADLLIECCEMFSLHRSLCVHSLRCWDVLELKRYG
jgi:hypothetical protein